MFFILIDASRIQITNQGEEVPDDPFDSNCITPGTAFMHRLGKHLVVNLI